MTISPTVGLLYPGEMGASLAKLLVAAGFPVVTTVANRSAATAERARDAGIKDLASLSDVVRESSLVISTVETSAAARVAESYAALADLAPRGAIYIDANSIGPETAQAIGAKIGPTRCDFVDAAFNGLAKSLATSGTLYLSGPRADEVASRFGSVMKVRVVGPEIGQASTMKMLLGGLTKGTCALFLELAVMAERRNMLPEMIEACSTIYPGIAALVDRMLPTYARHSGRRSVEMQELQQTLLNTGVKPCVFDAVGQLHEQLAAAEFNPADGSSVASFVKRIANDGQLAASPVPASAGNRVA